MQSVKTTPVSLKLDASMKARLDALAASKDRTVHQIMQDAIEGYVEREEYQEKLWRDALAIHEHYQLTGLHDSEERADGWLGHLEAGIDVDPPQCQR